MADGLEEPGWPNLKSGAPDPGATFLNAFYAVSQVNARKGALQDQIAKLNLQMQKQQFDEQFKEADFERKSEYQQMMGLLREKQYESTDEIRRGQLDIANQRLGLAQTVAGNKFDEIKTANADTDAYAQDVGKLKQQYEPGTREYGAGLDDIKFQHRDALNSKGGMALYKSDVEFHRSAALQMSKDAKQAREDFQDDLSVIGKNKDFQFDDFISGKWGRNNDGSRWIARDATTKQRLTPDEVKERDSAGINFYTLDAKNHSLLTKRAQRVQKYGSGDPSEQPDHVKDETGNPIPQPTQRDIETLKKYPEKARLFEARFGQGSSDQYLNQ